MRLVWQFLVPGSSFALSWWAFCLAVDVAYYAASGRILVSAWCMDLPLFLLNLASWDYQRRHNANS